MTAPPERYAAPPPLSDEQRHPNVREFYIGGQPVTRDEFAESQHTRAARMAARAPLATHWALNSLYN